MSSLAAALGTKLTIDDVINVRSEAKQISADGSEYPDARITSAPRKCIQVRNGTTNEQKEHRSGCRNEQCIIAFRVHGLWSQRPGQDAKKNRKMQSVTSSCGLNPHAVEFIPSETAGSVGPRNPASIPSGCMSLQSMGLMTGVEESDAEGSDAEGSDAKAIQDADSGGIVDLTATLS